MLHLTGEEENKSRTVTKGTKALQTVGKIHSDFEKGFISAEVIDRKLLTESETPTSRRRKGRYGTRERITPSGTGTSFCSASMYNQTI